MPIPELKVNSPQNWKKKKIYPSDRLIARRRAAAFKIPKKLEVGKERSSMKPIKKPIKRLDFSSARRKVLYGKRGDGWKNGLLKKFLKYILIVAVIIFIAGLSIFFYYGSQVPSRDEFLATADGSSTKVYDRTGEVVLYNLSGDLKKTYVPLDQLPEYVKWSVIAVEDDAFYAHRGFDLPALVKVGLYEVFRIGSPRGGSTLTQQLVKNALLTPEHTYRRKIKEMVISYYLEKKFTKDEILELYFNVVPYGSTAYGIEAASELYFGKQASDLNLNEVAVLAAMLKATTYYSPYGSHVDELLQRKNFVLDQMVAKGYISEGEADMAKNEKIEFKKLSQSIQAPHFVLYIKELLAEKYGEEIVEKGGLKVISTLDYDKQVIAENAVVAGVERNEKNYGAHNAALVSVDAGTGEVLAMVGSRDYFNEEYDGAVNVAMRPRQPGSSFKPIVYAASFEQGLTPETMLFDVVTKFKTDVEGDYIPLNYSNTVNGPVSIRKSLQGSLNIPAVKTLYLTGVDNVLNFAERLGYSTFGDRSRFGLSLVLGGGEVTLVDHVQAYAVFAQNGVAHKLRYILRIEDKNGKVLEEYIPEDEEGEEVVNQQIAKMLNNVLIDDEARAYIFGLGSKLTLPGRQVAAKTGTTNDYRDGWTIGYTPSLVTGVWVGNNDNSSMKGAASGGAVAAPIWNEYMRGALEGQPTEYFDVPEPYELPDKPMLDGNIGQETTVQIDKASGKLATSLTPPNFIEEKAFQELHSILHFVDKDNITGPIPEHPEKDRQYDSWEDGVISWAEENEVDIKEPLPTEYDDLHTEENKPSLKIDSPQSGEKFTSPVLNVDIKTSSSRTISRVEYYIDTQLIATVKNWPFNLNNYKLVGFENGEKWLRVISYDDIDNKREQSVRIYLDLSSEYAKPLTWLQPTNGATIHPEQHPYNVNVQINNDAIYNKVDFYVRNASGDSEWVGYTEVKSALASAEIVYLAPGKYEFYAVLSTNNGQTVKSEVIDIEVVNY